MPMPATEWENKFTRRLAGLQETSAVRFGRLVREQIRPAFEKIEGFLVAGGFGVSVLEPCKNVHAFRFTLSEEFFLDVIFSLKGPCEIQAAHRILSKHAHDTGVKITADIPLAEVTEAWARSQFEQALDAFMSEVERQIGIAADARKALAQKAR